MNKQITSVRLGVVIVLALAAVAGFVAGIALPAAPAAAPASVGSQAVTNYFRNVVVKPSDDTVALSLTQYTTPTANPLSINDSTGATVFSVSPVGNVEATTVYVNGYLRSANGPVTAFDDFTALKALTATEGVMIDGMVFTYTEPITITDVLTNVRLLFYQVP